MRPAMLPPIAVAATLLALVGAWFAGGAPAQRERAHRPDAAVATDATVVVFAAASLQGPLDAAAAAWTRRSGVGTTLVYGGTATLARQIAQGAPAHVFIGADREWADWLQARGYIAPGDRVDLFGNALVLVAPAGAEPALAAIGSLPVALRPGERVAIADPDTAPAGRYALAALQSLRIRAALEDRLARAADVRAALAFVARGDAPFGIVYASDARSEPRVRVVATFPAAAHPPIVHPAAALAGAPPAARDLVAFLRGDEAAATFRAAGFAVPARP